MEDLRPSRENALGRPLERLCAMGLVCPAHWTLTRFFDLLVAEGVLSEVAARDLVAVHHEAQYGAAAVERDRVLAAVETVLLELDRAAVSEGAALTRVAAALSPPPPSPQAGVEEPTPEASESSRAGAPPTENAARPPADDPEPAAPARSRWGSRARRRLAVAGALVLWSSLMLGLGSLSRPLFSRLWVDLKVRVLKLPQLVSPEDRLRAARDRAARQPGAAEIWLAYANLAEAQERYGEAVLALRHLIARSPDDPELLNNLAWLYCTAADPAARDAVQALELAERAYSLSQPPHITDTLAEAAFQNGDLQRAIALEEDALRRAGDNPEFYRQQLARFKAAAGGE